jgi:Flp pilus assembly protein TadG
MIAAPSTCHSVRRGSTQRRRRGAALVEMALVLPIFMMVVLGIIEFGRALWVGNMVTNAAREGARSAVLDGSSNAAVRTEIQSFLTASLGIPSSAVTTTITITPATGNPNPGNECANAKARDLIAITVTVPFNSVSLIPGKYLAGKNLVGRSSMRHE